MVKSPLCERDKPLTKTEAAGRALSAMKDMCRKGSTKEKGFEHLTRPWFTSRAAAAAAVAAARRGNPMSTDKLPRRVTIADALKKFVRKLDKYESEFE
jgi:hypothetical protein